MLWVHSIEFVNFLVPVFFAHHEHIMLFSSDQLQGAIARSQPALHVPTNCHVGFEFFENLATTHHSFVNDSVGLVGFEPRNTQLDFSPSPELGSLLLGIGSWLAAGLHIGLLDSASG
jgi:hypothetical protein